MLLYASIENYKSFWEKTFVDFTVSKVYKTVENYDSFLSIGKDIKNDKVSPVTGFFGKNAAGKTSLLEGIFGNISEISNENYNFLVDGFKFSNDEVNSVEFKVGFFLNEKIYDYSILFSYKQEKIIKEKLTRKDSMKSTQDIVLFDRPENILQTTFDSSFLPSDKSEYVVRFIKDNISLLSFNDDKQELGEIRKYFKSYDSIRISTSKKILSSSYFDKYFDLYEYEILELLNSSDFNIESVDKYEKKIRIKNTKNRLDREEYINEELENDSISILNTPIIEQKYNNKTATFAKSQLSHGTNIFLDYGALIVHKLKTGGVLFVDELSRGLSEELIKNIIKMFNNPQVNIGGAQLIFTDHNSDIINNLSPNQIFFISKDRQTGISKVTKVSDVKGYRFDQKKIVDLYKLGKFDTIPNTYIPIFG